MKYFCTALIASLMWSATTFAGPLLPLSVQDLTTAADVVLHGKVISKKVGRDDDGRIFTTVRLKVQDLWKGEVDSDIFEVVHGGGILGNRKVTAPYQVRYSMNEEAVIFCRINPSGKGVTIGLLQGKFEVKKAMQTSKRYVRNLFHGGLPPESGHAQLRYRMPHQLPLSIESLKTQVQGGVK
ncbi:MAG: hypothetical protein HOI50_09500 [Verrucomicrobia bacterium]|nr:hypothetical protein [Verrucomicrobiota bacterium]MBT6238584.1 hypothetical protein [Verrucomicrobiota bacterium]